MNFNSVIDRALSEHLGSGLLSKKSNGKYSIFLPVTNTGEIGSAPSQIQKTVVGNMAHSYVAGRKDSPQLTLTFFVHRDNLRILEAVKGKVVEFLRIFPDFTAVKFSASVNYKYNDTAVGDTAEQGEITLTVTIPEEVVDNCFDLVEDTTVFISDVPSVLNLTTTGNEIINIETNPGDAEVTAVVETEGICTATYAEGKVTITGVKTGSSVVKLTAKAEGYAEWSRTILVIVA